MFSKNIVVKSTTLSYLEQNPGGIHTIFFFHGNANSARLWHNQLQDDQLTAYRLIAFDLPGHGHASDTYPQSDYNVVAMACLMAEAVNTLKQNKEFLLVGLSLGSNIVAEMLNFDISPRGVVLVCPSLVGSGITPAHTISDPLTAEVLFSENAPLKLVKRYLAKASLSRNKLDKMLLLEDYHKVKSGFRTALSNSIKQGIYSDEVAFIKKQPAPILVMLGKQDEIITQTLVEKMELPLWNKKIYIIDAASHLANLDQPLAFNATLKLFLQDVFKLNGV